MLLLQARVLALVCLAACLAATLAYEVRNRCLSFSFPVTFRAEPQLAGHAWVQSTAVFTTSFQPILSFTQSVDLVLARPQDGSDSNPTNYAAEAVRYKARSCSSNSTVSVER